MKKLEEIGTCPKCDFSIFSYKTTQYKRFAKCSNCGTSYSLPKRGKLLNSALTCPIRNFPILIVDRNEGRAFFWADQPCFNCVHYDKCEPISELVSEFKELEVYGY
ncbi:MAG: hypothetical protein JW891_06270 [Candidatus Lokiarchaeota archaeon]|nr:hypothetical protein [Candidatus Lokiarchaeota archaeon]